MAKRNIEPIWVARTAEWHITYDRQTQDYAAFIDGDVLVLVGFYRTQSAAEQACREYTFQGLRVAA